MPRYVTECKVYRAARRLGGKSERSNTIAVSGSQRRELRYDTAFSELRRRSKLRGYPFAEGYMNDAARGIKMRILFVAPFVPWPLAHGGRIRVFNLVSELARRHEITLVCLADRVGCPLGPLPEICRQVVPVLHRPNIVASFFRFLLGGNPYNVERYSSGALLAAIGALRVAPFDLAHIEMPEIWSCVKACGGLPIVLGTQNVESRVLEQLASVCRNPLKRALYGIERAKMSRFEEAAWRESQLCLTVSDQERAAVLAAGVEPGRVVTIPNGVDLARFSLAPRAGRKRLMFLGGLDYHPNLDALRWLLSEIWPRVRERESDAQLLLAGRGTEKFAVSDPSSGITCIGDPNDVPSCLADADGLLVPLRVGAGTRLKVLESMAAGLPVVTTTRGGEGTAAVSGKHLLLADTPQDFADCCIRLLVDPALVATLTTNARRLVEDHYSWDQIGIRLLEAIDGVAGGKAGP